MPMCDCEVCFCAIQAAIIQAVTIISFHLIVGALLQPHAIANYLFTIYWIHFDWSIEFAFDWESQWCQYLADEWFGDGKNAKKN